jgi:hypothetical protein
MDLLERIRDRSRAVVFEKDGMVAVVVGDLGLTEDDALVMCCSETGFFLEKAGVVVVSIDPAPVKALEDVSGSQTVYVYQTPSEGGVEPIAEVVVVARNAVDIR